MIGVCVCGVLLLYFLLWLDTALFGHNLLILNQSVLSVPSCTRGDNKGPPSGYVCCCCSGGLSRVISLCFWGPSQRFASMSLWVSIAGPFREFSLKTCITLVLESSAPLLDYFCLAFIWDVGPVWNTSFLRWRLWSSSTPTHRTLRTLQLMILIFVLMPKLVDLQISLSIAKDWLALGILVLTSCSVTICCPGTQILLCPLVVFPFGCYLSFIWELF